MKFSRVFTTGGIPVEQQISWKTVESKITAADGTTVFHMPEVEVPAHWSQTAANILAQKYFRKAGVPVDGDLILENEKGIPEWLQRCTTDGDPATFGSETSAKQVFHRLAGAWTYWGWKEGYFGHPERVDGGSYHNQTESARIFYDEIYYMLAMQFAAPNSPQWFNCFSGRETFISQEHGVLSLQEAVGLRLTVWTRSGWKNAEIKAFGKQKLQRVTFAPAYFKNDDYRPCWTLGKTNMRVTIDVTPDHRWPLATGGDTTRLDYVHIVEASAARTFDHQHESYRQGFAHGVIFGDGSVAYRFKDGITKRYRARLCGHKRELKWAFDNVGYPECFGGEPLVQLISRIDLKEFPCNTDNYIYLNGFLDGWIATDGSERSASIRLSTIRLDAENWLRTFAALSGWTLAGLSTDYGSNDEKNPLFVFTLTQRPRGWKVVHIENLTEEEEVFCAIVNDVHEFTLSSGIVTGNCGLYWAYGIEGPDSSQWTCNNGTPERVHNSYSQPQVHACYIQPVADDLVNPGGIMDLWTREVRLFKHGSGTGTNFSTLRGKGELLSGGGRSSGLMSFLRIGDTSAGAIKSGGTTRRAAKMVVVDLDHPEIEAFINWKVDEDKKARALVAAGWSEDEAVATISGQNSNNSVRVPDKFLERVDQNGEWDLVWRTDSNEGEAVDAVKLWQQICSAAWACGDPGVQFHDTIQAWHTCKADGEINATNPCSEYIFLDNTACNLASLNLCRFLDESQNFDNKKFKHAVRIWTTILDISVSMASYPSAEIALGSYNYRTLGLGYANLGGLLMRKAVAYDSDEGRQIAANITATMNAAAYATSAELAAELGVFPRFEANRHYMQVVLKRHGIIPHASGYRNAQTTLIAPTGTIALLMNCDTTGIEPAFALRTSKNLAGGGTINATNWAVMDALLKLNYTPAQVNEVANWIESRRELVDMPPRNGQPFIDPEHLPIFATAVGKNALRPEAHVWMVAAVQPYLSGGVSKTVNMPQDSTVEDVDRIYRMAHKLGLKSISIYRDGSKVVQPLSTTKPEATISSTISTASILVGSIENESFQTRVETITGGYTEDPETDSAEDEADIKIAELRLAELRGARVPLTPRRKGYIQKVKIDNNSLYLHTGEYPDGTLGEIFIDLSREGSTLRSIMECFSKAISIGIQYGVPLEKFVKAFIHTKFEPAGIVQGHERIKFCSSIVDLVFRDLGINYLHQELGHVKTESTKLKEQFLQKKETPTQNIPAGRVVDICWECGSATLIHTGSCVLCTNCYASSGCG